VQIEGTGELIEGAKWSIGGARPFGPHHLSALRMPGLRPLVGEFSAVASFTQNVLPAVIEWRCRLEARITLA
jgi:hypothetical protein